MKRVLSIVLLLALAVPVLLIPVKAAEVYEFYLDEASAISSENDFTGGPPSFTHPALLPSGSYMVSFRYSDAIIDVVLRDFVVGAGDCYSEEFSLPGFEGSYSFRMIAFDSWTYTSLELCDSNRQKTYVPGISSVVATLIVNDPMPALSDYVSNDCLYGVLNEIVAVLPVVLVSMVAWIGIRKCLAWVQNQLHGV